MSQVEQAASITASTSEGYVFDPSPSVWILGSGCASLRFDFEAIPAVSKNLRKVIKSVTLAWVCARRTSTVRTNLHMIRKLLRHVSAADPGTTLDEIGLDHVSAFVTLLPHSSKYHAAQLVNALRHWATIDRRGLSTELFDELPYLEYDWHVAGQAVRTCCPVKGALTIEQRDALVLRLDEAYRAGRSSLADHCATLYTTISGIRPYQMACLKVCDITPSSEPDIYVADINVPRAKQPGATLPRSAFTRKGLLSELADLFHHQCNASRAWAALHDIDPSQAPIFPVAVASGKALPPRIPGLAGHMEPGRLSTKITKLIARLDAVPGRAAGERVTPLRLRRTKASAMAEEGETLEDIAAELDQNSVASPLFYLQQTASLATRLDEALGTQFVDFARGFITETPKPARRACRMRTRHEK